MKVGLGFTNWKGLEKASLRAKCGEGERDEKRDIEPFVRLLELEAIRAVTTVTALHVPKAQPGGDRFWHFCLRSCKIGR